MDNITLPSDLIVKQIEHANELASRLLLSPLGGFTNEDVVGEFLLDEIQRGKDLNEIGRSLNSPKLRTYLRNVKTDCFRKESAIKRGGREPKASFEDVEPLSKSTYDDPETALIKKENESNNASILNLLFENAQLSTTQLEILALSRKGFTCLEIATKLDMNEDTVYARKSEAIKKLSKLAKQISVK